MKKLLFVTVVSCVMVAVAYAQAPQAPPDVGFLQGAIVALQQQRNEALDKAAEALARLSGVQRQLSETQAELAQLKASMSAPAPTRSPASPLAPPNTNEAPK